MIMVVMITKMMGNVMMMVEVRVMMMRMRMSKANTMSSIMKGGTFSPPAVMRISLILSKMIEIDFD